MKPLNLYLAKVKFTQGHQFKVRPVLILYVNTELFIAYKITTKFKNKSARIKKYYYRIKNWKFAGLNYQSYVDTYKPIELNKDRIIYKQSLGRLNNSDILMLYNFISNQQNTY